MTARPDEARGALVLELRGAGVSDVDVLRAIETVPREEFLPPHLRHYGARNIAVPIACGQTMPPPLNLALALQALSVRPTDRVLEIGTGSGYATAVLARLAREVVSFERYRGLAEQATVHLASLAIPAVVRFGDGLAALDDLGHFDRILVHAAIPTVPSPLADVLANDGRIVAGVPAENGGSTALAVFERNGSGFTCRRLVPMRFSPAQAGVAAVL